MNTASKPPQVIEHLLVVYKKWYAYRDGMPKKSRYVLADKIDTRFVQVLELLQIASYQNPADKIYTLSRALTGTDILKFLLRVAWEIRALDEKKYLELSEGLNEVGKQVNGWHKGLQTKTTSG